MTTRSVSDASLTVISIFCALGVFASSIPAKAAPFPPITSPGNPLGARAMYLGRTVYCIHGTNAPETIGTRISSGCIRLTNQDVADLYTRVTVGTKVVVLPVERHVGVTERSKQL
jgi:L,D-transpeptidase catalytic domain